MDSIVFFLPLPFFALVAIFGIVYSHWGYSQISLSDNRRLLGSTLYSGLFIGATSIFFGFVIGLYLLCVYCVLIPLTFRFVTETSFIRKAIFVVGSCLISVSFSFLYFQILSRLP